MLVLAQTEVEEGGVQVKNPLSRGGGNNSSRGGSFRGPPPKFKNHQKWFAPQQKNNQNKIHQLILPTVLMTHATNVEEVGIGHALAVPQMK